MALGKNAAVVRQLRTLFNLGTIRELTDGQLLERFATCSGEAAELAFAALIERHGPMVLRVCRSVLADPHDSQDAFQATFLVLVKRARGLWVRDSLGPWLHQVAYRTASCARLAAVRRHRHEQGAAALRNEARVEVLGDDLACVLHEEIERLPERFRAPLVLCDLEGRSHEQAARHLGWPIGTVKSRQARGRERLRERLRRRGVAPPATVLAAALRPDATPSLVSPSLVETTATAAIEFFTNCAIVSSSAASLAQGVLKSMSITQCLKVASSALIVGVITSGAALLAQRAGSVDRSQPKASAPVARSDGISVHVAVPGKLRVTAIERGVLESSENRDAYCLVEGQTTIIYLRPEGSAVKKGEIVCQLDSAGLKDRLVNQIIAERTTEATYQNAVLAREVAELAIREYDEGILKRERTASDGAMTVARSAVQKAQARLDRTRSARKRLNDVLAAKGGSTSPTDIMAGLDIDDRLEAAEHTLLKEKVALEIAKSTQELLEEHTSAKTAKELRVDVERKRLEELARKYGWELDQSKRKKLEKQITYCDIIAPADGMVVYANEPSLGRVRPRIEEGATVRERQKIFRLPDMSRMQVNIRVRESQIDKIARNMKAKVRIDAFLDLVLNGRVIDVAPLPDSANVLGDKQVFATKVWVENRLPGLRPGMTAQVEILVSELDNVLSVPVEAVVRYDDKDHVAVKKPDGAIEWQQVRLGQSNDQLVEVTQGIKNGEHVVVKPHVLLSEEQKRKMSGTMNEPGAKPRIPR